MAAVPPLAAAAFKIMRPLVQPRLGESGSQGLPKTKGKALGSSQLTPQRYWQRGAARPLCPRAPSPPQRVRNYKALAKASATRVKLTPSLPRASKQSSFCVLLNSGEPWQLGSVMRLETFPGKVSCPANHRRRPAVGHTLWAASHKCTGVAPASSADNEVQSC